MRRMLVAVQREHKSKRQGWQQTIDTPELLVRQGTEGQHRTKGKNHASLKTGVNQVTDRKASWEGGRLPHNVCIESNVEELKTKTSRVMTPAFTKLPSHSHN